MLRQQPALPLCLISSWFSFWGKKPQQRGKYLYHALDANHLNRCSYCATAIFGIERKTRLSACPPTKAGGQMGRAVADKPQGRRTSRPLESHLAVDTSRAETPMTQFAKETLPVSLEEEMRRSYLDYAMSVIVGRALPDARDGLKPVHRRVLFAMHELSNDWNKAYKKSARIVGDVIGKYHPHGDSAVYETIVRMAQDFSLRHMLVDGQGNFGSVDGDNAAAMRYTEIRMSKIAHELLADLDKETVDFGPNYDGSEQEPLVMPTRLPNLLVNGSSGIAVGMATNIPPHNLNEAVDACMHLLRNPQASIDELMEIIPAPDFPTAGIIYGINGVKDGYRTGRGRVVMRAKVHFEDIDKGQRQPSSSMSCRTRSTRRRCKSAWLSWCMRKKLKASATFR